MCNFFVITETVEGALLWPESGHLWLVKQSSLWSRWCHISVIFVILVTNVYFFLAAETVRVFYSDWCSCQAWTLDITCKYLNKDNKKYYKKWGMYFVVMNKGILFQIVEPENGIILFYNPLMERRSQILAVKRNWWYKSHECIIIF